MDDSSEIIQSRKNKVIAWIKDPYTLTFITILILGIVIRLYYFSLTKSQPLWWDEADYMAYAKNLAGFPVEWSVSSQHNTLFYYIVALLFKFALSEVAIKFILEILPSILIIAIVYFISVEAYKDKKIALISAFLMATLWSILFNSMRFHLGIPALFFGLLAILVFWQGYEKKKLIFGKIKSHWAIPLVAVLSVLSYGFRRGYFVFGFFFIIYMLLTRKFTHLVKDKYNWIALAVSIPLILFLEFFAFLAPITKVAAKYTSGETPFNLLPFDVFSAFFQNTSNALASPLLYLFWLGALALLANIFISLGHIRKSQNSKVRSDLFFILTIAITLSYFLFYQQAQGDFGEPRWYFPLLMGSFICISRSTTIIANFFKKYHKYIPIIIIVVLVGYGGYYQIQHADPIIKSKVSSFTGVKEAGLFIQSNSNPSDSSLGYPTPVLAYYSERNVEDPEWIFEKRFSEVSLEEFTQAMKDNPEIRYLVIYIFEPALPPWMVQLNYFQNSQNGQTIIGSIEVPFMDTQLDLINQQQTVKETMEIDGITFRLASTHQDTFIYEISR